MKCTCDSRAGQSERAHAREILEMIAYKRVAKKINIEKAQHWEERNNEISSGKEHREPPGCADQPQKSQESQRGDDWEISGQLRGIDSPPRIDENQRIGPDELSEVKPNCAAGDDNAFGRRLRPLRAHRAGVKLLFPDSPRARQSGKHNKGNKCSNIRQADAPFTPPD